MSTIPNDLAVASEFAAQDLPPATIVKAEQTKVKEEQAEPSKVVDSAATSNAEAAPNSPSVKAEPVSKHSHHQATNWLTCMMTRWR